MSDFLLSEIINDYTEKRPAIVDGYPDAHTVWLKVGVQRFCVTPDYADNAEYAELFREMLGKALLTLIRLEFKGENHEPLTPNN